MITLFAAFNLALQAGSSQACVLCSRLAFIASALAASVRAMCFLTMHVSFLLPGPALSLALLLTGQTCILSMYFCYILHQFLLAKIHLLCRLDMHWLAV